MRIYSILLIQIIFVSLVNGWTFGEELNVRSRFSSAVTGAVINVMVEQVLPRLHSLILENAANGIAESHYEHYATAAGLDFKFEADFQDAEKGDIGRLAGFAFSASLDALFKQLTRNDFYSDFGLHFFCDTCDQPGGGARFRVRRYRETLRLSDTKSFFLKVDQDLDSINGVKDPKYTSGGIGVDLSQSTKNIYPQFSASRNNGTASVAAAMTCMTDHYLNPLYQYILDCGTSDAVVPFYQLHKGSSRWSRDGLKRLYVQSNGDICIWHYPKSVPTMLWCWSHGIDFTKDNGFFGAVTNLGQLCLYSYIGGPARVCSDSSKKGPDTSQYRLRIENTGLLAMYYVSGSNQLWSNGFTPFPSAINQIVCNGRVGCHN